jgi:flagellar biosynthesis/type III secretory pathway M-ring protein FliF/YscJ
MAGTALEAENAREMHLTRKAQEMLDATLGPGHSQVKVAVKMDFTKRTEASSNPDKSMVLKEQTTATEENTPVFPSAGVAGTASNVESADSGTAGKPANAKKTNEETRNEYVVGQRTITQEDELGRITGMTVSILLDHREVKVAKKDDKGQPTKEMESTFEPIAPAEQAKLKELVLNAIGFYSAKGVASRESPQTVDDRFKSSIESIRMWREESGAAPAAATAPPLGVPLKDWIGYGIAAVVALIALVIARGQLKKSNAAWQAAEERARREAEERAAAARGEAEGDTRGRRQELKDQIKRSIQSDPAAAAAILRKWIHGEQAR